MLDSKTCPTPTGEITGCCELRTMQEILITMTDREWDIYPTRLIKNENKDPGWYWRTFNTIMEKYDVGVKFRNQ